MLDQIRVKQSYTNRNSKKQQEKRKKELKKMFLTYKNYIIILAAVLVLLLWLILAQRYFLNNSKFLVQEITYEELDKTFNNNELTASLDNRRNTNYRKTKRWITNTLNQNPDPWINKITTTTFSENILHIEIFYKTPEIVFKNNEITWGSIGKSLKILSWSLINADTPIFSLPQYHSWDITWIFHKVDSSDLQLWYRSLANEISPEFIEFHPWISKIIAFKENAKIIFDIEDPIQQQIDKYELITQYFSGNLAQEYDLSSAPYAIIKQ
jgi:hypothetical protein